MRMVFGTIQTLMMSCYNSQKENEHLIEFRPHCLRTIHLVYLLISIFRVHRK